MSVEYVEGEDVLAHNGPLLYVAKVLTVQETADKKKRYFVHYKGWNKNWDEWVDPSQMAKLDAAGLQRQKEISDELRAAQEESKKKKSSKRAANDDEKKKGKKEEGGKGKKRKTEEEDDSVETEVDRAGRQEIKLVLPGPLKKRLVQDWELINRKHKLVQLPREVTVSKILSEYHESKKGKLKPSGADAKNSAEICDGLRVYFDRALYPTLLYRYELPQFEDIKQTDPSSLCDVYGAEHLLRLLVKLPSLFTETTMSDVQVGIVQKCISDFIRFFHKKQAEFFAGPYTEPMDDAYTRRVPAAPANQAAQAVADKS